jgi:PAS domain S-box-containing protein
MFSTIVIILSSLLFSFTAIWAIRLVQIARNRFAWIIFSVGFSLLALIKLYELFEYFFRSGISNFSASHNISELLLSLLVTIGVLLVGEVFNYINTEEMTRIESETRFKTLFNNSSDQIYVIDLYGNFVEVNQVIIDLLGYSKEEFMNMHIRKIKSPKYVGTIQSLLEKIKSEGKLIFEAEHISKNGQIIPVEINSRLIEYSHGKAILSMARDITERKQTERRVLNAIIETEEKEKERFAKDLHDGLGTLLSSINIYISLLKSGKVDDTQRDNLFDYTKGLIDEAIMNAKEIANNLRPNIISRFGLVASVKSLCEKINHTGVITIDFTTTNVKKDELFSKDIEVPFYRIINELINNTLKHASADRVDMHLTKENRTLMLTYTDNGKGFNVEETLRSRSNKGMGLSNIASRVNAMNGNLDISSNSEKGTEVKVNIKI